MVGFVDRFVHGISAGRCVISSNLSDMATIASIDMCIDVRARMISESFTDKTPSIRLALDFRSIISIDTMSSGSNTSSSSAAPKGGLSSVDKGVLPSSTATLNGGTFSGFSSASTRFGATKETLINLYSKEVEGIKNRISSYEDRLTLPNNSPTDIKTFERALKDLNGELAIVLDQYNKATGATITKKGKEPVKGVRSSQRMRARATSVIIALNENQNVNHVEAREYTQYTVKIRAFNDQQYS